MKRFIFIFALFLATATMMAEGFKVGNLTFEIINFDEVELSKADTSITSIFLNPTITNNGITYKVTTI
jgi:hypothetical protein